MSEEQRTAINESVPGRRLRWLSRPDGRIGVSPIHASLGGLPLLLIRAGSYELLLDDPIRLCGRAAADDVVVTLEVT